MIFVRNQWPWGRLWVSHHTLDSSHILKANDRNKLLDTANKLVVAGAGNTDEIGEGD